MRWIFTDSNAQNTFHRFICQCLLLFLLISCWCYSVASTFNDSDNTSSVYFDGKKHDKDEQIPTSNDKNDIKGTEQPTLLVYETNLDTASDSSSSSDENDNDSQVYASWWRKLFEKCFKRRRHRMKRKRSNSNRLNADVEDKKEESKRRNPLFEGTKKRSSKGNIFDDFKHSDHSDSTSNPITMANTSPFGVRCRFSTSHTSTAKYVQCSTLETSSKWMSYFEQFITKLCKGSLSANSMTRFLPFRESMPQFIDLNNYDLMHKLASNQITLHSTNLNKRKKWQHAPDDERKSQSPYLPSSTFTRPACLHPDHIFSNQEGKLNNEDEKELDNKITAWLTAWHHVLSKQRRSESKRRSNNKSDDHNEDEKHPIAPTPEWLSQCLPTGRLISQPLIHEADSTLVVYKIFGSYLQPIAPWNGLCLLEDLGTNNFFMHHVPHFGMIKELFVKEGQQVKNKGVTWMDLIVWGQHGPDLCLGTHLVDQNGARVEVKQKKQASDLIETVPEAISPSSSIPDSSMACPDWLTQHLYDRCLAQGFNAYFDFLDQYPPPLSMHERHFLLWMMIVAVRKHSSQGATDSFQKIEKMCSMYGIPARPLVYKNEDSEKTSIAYLPEVGSQPLAMNSLLYIMGNGHVKLFNKFSTHMKDWSGTSNQVQQTHIHIVQKRKDNTSVGKGHLIFRALYF